MAMQCIKTGAHVKVSGRYAYGDLFSLGDPLSPAGGYMVLRCVQWGFGPIFNTIHAEFETWDEWWDQEGEVGTVMLGYCSWFDYTGRPSVIEVK